MTEQSDKDSSARLFPSFGVLISNFVIAISVVPLALFVFSLLGRQFYYAELVGNFRCQIMYSLIPFAFFAFGTRRWWLGGMILIAVLWSMIGIIWVHLPGFQPPPGPQTLTVMSYNVLAPNSNHSEVADQIRAADADVVTILEYAINWHHGLESLTETYPHNVRIPRWHGFGIAIFSKYPLSNTEVVQLTKTQTDDPFIMTDVAFGDQTIRLAGLHVISPISRYRLKLRNEQFAEVAELLSKRNLPTVVMGDFNCTPWSPFLVDFAKKTGYRDSRKGFGYHATWPADKWMLQIPIDHAFVSPDIHVHNRWVGKRSESDHLPILFEISTAK